jgi:hypothetical protein
LENYKFDITKYSIELCIGLWIYISFFFTREDKLIEVKDIFFFQIICLLKGINKKRTWYNHFVRKRLTVFQLIFLLDELI